MQPVITAHAAKRVRKRLGVPKSKVINIVNSAVANGALPKDFSGGFRRYLDSLRHNQGVADYAYVWNHYVWMFKGHHLITVISVPQKYRRQSAIIKTPPHNHKRGE